MFSAPSSPLFCGDSLRSKIKKQETKVESDIKNTPDQTILTVNKDNLIEKTVQKHELNVPEIDFDERQGVPEGTAENSKLILHFPYTGDAKWFKYQPSSYRSDLGKYKFAVEERFIKYEMELHNKPGKRQKSEVNKVTQYLQSYSTRVVGSLNNFNSKLPDLVEKHFDRYKKDVEKKHRTLDSLDIPIKKRSDVPETFAVEGPESREKITVSDRGDDNFKESGELEPELDQEIYQEILQTVYDVGKGFERSPHLFAGKEEEDLRDHILFYLEANFEGSATGETFNRSGKTDILLRYEGDNLFVAECGIWDGPKWCDEKLTQLLEYLTWRDSKASLIVFIKRKKIEPVLDKLDNTVRGYQNFVGYNGEKGESWQGYKMHLPDDEDREIHLGVIAVHLPE